MGKLLRNLRQQPGQTLQTLGISCQVPLEILTGLYAFVCSNLYHWIGWLAFAQLPGTMAPLHK